MATSRDFGDPEKKTASPLGSEQDVEQGTVFEKSDHRRRSLTGRKSSVAESIIAADLLDERYATTQRGLKSRHAQMIALGMQSFANYVHC
jgi:amino acid permease